MDDEPRPRDAGCGDDACHPVDPSSAALACLDTDVHVLQSAKTSVWSAGEHVQVLTDLVRARARLEAAYLHVLERFDARPDAPTAVGASTSAGAAARTLLVHACGLDAGQARRDVLVARAVATDGSGVVPEEPDGAADPRVGPDSTGLPRVGAALAAGEVTRAHVDAAQSCLAQIPHRLLARIDDEGWSGAARVDAFLAEHARRLSPRQTARLGRQLLEALDPAGADRYDPQAHQRRDLTYHRDSTGMLIGRFALDPAAGSVLRAAIDALVTQGLTRSGSGQVPDDVTTPEAAEPEPIVDDRTPGQRRADALVDLARGVLADDGRSPSGGTVGGVTTHIHVLATLEQVEAARRAQPAAVDESGLPLEPPAPSGPAHARGDPESATPLTTPAPGLADDLGDAEPLAPGTCSRLLCEAVLDITLLDDAGAVLNLGRATRLATPAQRRAVVARDRGCVVPGCPAPPQWCEVHHVVWWRHGGGTDITNLAMLCSSHHTAVHTGHWQLQMIDGVPWAVPPPTLDASRTPRRNTYWQAVDGARRLGQTLGDRGSQGPGSRPRPLHDDADPLADTG